MLSTHDLLRREMTLVDLQKAQWERRLKKSEPVMWASCGVDVTAVVMLKGILTASHRKDACYGITARVTANQPATLKHCHNEPGDSDSVH